MDPFENEHMLGMGMKNAMNGLDGERGVQQAADAPFIEYWMWHEGELVLATPEELEWIHERERERDARWRLKQWQQRQQQAQPRDTRWGSLRAVCAAVTGRLASGGEGAVRSTSRTVRTEATREKWATPTER